MQNYVKCDIIYNIKKYITTLEDFTMATMANYYNYEEEKRQEEELVRFYQQQRSNMQECNFGSKNCEKCEYEEGCKIKQFIPR